MEQHKKNLIYLTGFMGSGKSTIAPILANTLGYDYVDVDKEIEIESGKQITEIFSDLGEEYFRDIEQNILHRVSKRTSCVVSLGGGTISNDANVMIIKTSGILVYLKADAEHIYQRLKHKNDRPMLRGNDGVLLTDDDLRARIATLLQTRERYYRQADITVSSGDQRVGITVDQIVRELQRWIS